MAIQIYSPVGVDITRTETSPKFKLGTMAEGTDGSKWIYVKANSAITQYMWVGIDYAFLANPGTKTHLDSGRRPGLAQVAFSANEYGWVATRGGNNELYVKAKNSCAISVALYSTATAGYVDDTSASQTLINGLVLTDTSTASGASKTCLAMTDLFPVPTP
jgi:hypothetical protein